LQEKLRGHLFHVLLHFYDRHFSTLPPSSPPLCVYLLGQVSGTAEQKLKVLQKKDNFSAD
jgi:hypothetical protein